MVSLPAFFHMKVLKLRKIIQLAQGHSSNKYSYKNSTSGNLAPECMHLTTMTYDFREKLSIIGVRREEWQSTSGIQRREKITSPEGIRKEFMRTWHVLKLGGHVRCGG